MGRAEIEAVLQDEGRAEARCEFCGERWVLDEAELRSLLASS
jgi:redox-regulated HSP33 family molecular chaperone